MSNRGSPGGHEAGQTKGPEVGGSARAEDRTLHDIENISVLETEEAVKKIYLITGAALRQPPGAFFVRDIRALFQANTMPLG